MKRLASVALVALSILISSVGSTSIPTAVPTALRTTPDLEVWISGQRAISETKMYNNFSPAGSVPGTILASPSQHEPNYYYYWVRDGALVMQSVLDLYLHGSKQESKTALTKLETFVGFSRQNQISAEHNFGEPRFNIDGAVNTEPWGRPQNDGPALRALLFTRLANKLLDEGRRDFVLEKLYAPSLPAQTVIKTDLEFTAHNWRVKCIDLWEEVWGYHFFTQASQFIALQEGATLAERLGDPGAAAFYRSQAGEIERELKNHWSEEKGYYLSTLEYSSGPDHSKPSQLDVSVVLAALAAEQDTGLLSVSDDRILKTAGAVEDSFKTLYGLNRDLSTGTAIGRYPEDYYFGGNPWVLTTAAYAELNYKLADLISRSKSFVLTETQARFSGIEGLSAGIDLASNRVLRAQVVEALLVKGDRYLERVRRHANVDGSLSEQYGRDHGKMISARDLSWSYASVLRAFTARAKANTSK